MRVDVKPMERAVEVKEDEPKCVTKTMKEKNENDKDTEKKPIEDEKTTVSSAWSVFASNTTAHGYSQLLITSSIALRIFWVCVILTCYIGLYMQITPLYKKYTDKPISSKISLREDLIPAFPSVILCNTNMIKMKDKVELLNLEQTGLKPPKIGKKEEPATTDDDDDDGGDDAELTLHLVQKAKKHYSDMGGESDDINIEQVRRMNSLKDTREAVSNKIMAGEGVANLGHSFNRTIQTCQWRKVYDCKKEKYWYRYWHWKYGNCFMFNGGLGWNGTERTPLKATETGIENGLKLLLNIERKDYDTDTEEAGMVLYLGDQGVRADPAVSGHSLAPGYSHVGSIRKQMRFRADPHRNGSCIRDYEMDLGIRSQGPRIIPKYSKELCQEKCVAETMNENCGCTEYSLPSFESTTTCNRTDITNDCVSQIRTNFFNGSLPCLKACQLPCAEIKYDLQLSSSKYPVVKEKSYLEGDDPDENALKLTLYYKTFEMFVIEDEEYYLVENLLGDIGGTLGLWSGFSVMTICEISFFIPSSVYMIIMYLITRKR